MTEEKLAPQQQKPRNWRLIGLLLAALITLAAALWLFRQPVAGLIVQSICGGQKLDCTFRVTRVDFGGITLGGVDIRGPDASNPALSARRVAVDLAWDGVFSPRPAWIGGDEVVMRVDLSGTRPLLGDLDQAVKNFTRGGGEPGPMPRLDFRDIRVIGDTPIGSVEARGRLLATAPNAFSLQLAAPAATLGFDNAELQLNGAELTAMANDGEIDAKAKLDLAKFETEHASIVDVKIEASLVQAAGVLKGEGAASLTRAQLQETKLADVTATAAVNSAAIDPAAFDIEAWLRTVQQLDISAAAGEGAVDGTQWKSADLTARLSAAEGGGSAGEAAFAAEDVKLAQGAVGRLEIVGSVSAPAEGQMKAQGVARAQGAILNRAARTELANAISSPLEATLPAFAEAARRAIDRAADAFDVSAPWSAAAVESGFGVSLLTGASLRAGSGLELRLSAPQAKQQVVSFSTEGSQWTAAGSLALSGGGAPAMTVDVARATGAAKTLSMAGAAAIKPWRVGNDVLAAEATGLEFDTTEDGGSAAGQFTVRLDGELAGGSWKGARGTGAIKSAWTPTSFYADAPRGLVVQWDEGAYGETVIGAGALHFTPRGRLAERQGEAVVGQGMLAPMKAPVRGGAFTAQTEIGATAVNWRAQGGLLAAFDAAPSTIAFSLGERLAPMRVEDIAGTLDLRRGWRIRGALRGGEVKADEATLDDIEGRFDLGGEHGSLDGSLSGVTLRMFDPLPTDKRRYEEVKFAGSATLIDSVAGFSGGFTLAKSGVQIANVKGGHSLDDGVGSLTFAPTPLIFRPRSFQPYDLSPLLRGPANVTGRVDIAGAADWSDEGVKLAATLDLRDLGFALAAAGVFERVSGKVEIGDVIAMTSAPGQTIRLGRVTLGLPLENGTVRFQLIGYDAIRIESAEWPFVGGAIQVNAAEFVFGAAQNRIVARAVNWDLTKIIELFKIPDIRIDGVVNGDIPVVFSTGSAEIDQAELDASKRGGVIQYTGSTGDAAAEADPNAKMLFDALKDFRYKVLKVGLDGDIAGRIVLSMNLEGHNPGVLNGTPFNLNISVDSALMNLLNMTSLEDLIKAEIVPAPVSD